ncbi:hypothetical protein DMH04_41415 [Kibdelosporangium aridum]|uniref:Helix-turn-helix domain-containing protein n=1 Tax=Kibdelosporangium aridum TaxID=2030 RepID=A0A428YUS9_KIBAR|nr:hypothetical protein DMH04_41415 [Kibdelosporangium aridum]
MVTRYWWGNAPRVILPVAIFPQLTVGLPAARVYAAMAMRADNRSGLVDSTFEQIAEDAGMTRRRAAEGVALLLAAGWVEQVRKGNSRVSSKYRLRVEPVTVDSVETDTTNGADIDTLNGADSDTVNGVETGTTEEVGQCRNRHFVVSKSTPPLVSPSSSPTTSLADGGTNDAEQSQDDSTPPLLVLVPDPVEPPTKPAKNAYTPEFETFWVAYPRRDDGRRGSKSAAFENWKKAIKTVSPETLTAAVAQYARSKIVLNGYAMDAKRWLSPREKGWEEFTEDLATVDPVDTYESLYSAADAKGAADLIREPYADPSQHPSDPTPRVEWLRARRRDFIEAHEQDIRAALTKAVASR